MERIHMKTKYMPSTSHPRPSKVDIHSGARKHLFETVDDKAFQELKKQLHESGYSEIVGFESVALVKRLFSELTSMRDTQQTLTQHLNDKNSSELNLQRQLHPLQKEISRLVRENNQLHLELIQSGEESEALKSKHKLSTKQYEGKIRDQQFMISEQAKHIHSLEGKVQEQKERIESLLDNHWVYTASNSGESVPIGMEISMSANPSPPQPEIDHAVEQEFVDLHDATAKQILMLEEKLQESASTQVQLQTELDVLQLKLKNREKEILRMGKLLSQNINSEQEYLEKQVDTKDETIKRLNQQLDFLSEQVALGESLKSDLEGVREENRKLNVKNRHLNEQVAQAEEELTKLRFAHEYEKENVIHERYETNERDKKCWSFESAVEDLKAQKHDLSQKLEAVMGEKQELLAELAHVTQEHRTSIEDVGNLQKELAEMKRLRDNLYAVVMDFEDQMAVVQERIKGLAQEREEQSLLCSQTADRLHEREDQLTQCARYITSLEAQVRLLTSKQSVQQDGKMEDFSNQFEKLMIESEKSLEFVCTTFEDLNQRVKTLVEGSTGSLQLLADEKERCMELQTEMESLLESLARKDEALKELQTLMSHMDEAKGNAALQIQSYRKEMETLQGRNLSLEGEKEELVGRLERVELELSQMKIMIAEVDRERDVLVAQLDEKCSRIGEQESRVGELTQRNEQNVANVSSLRQQVDLMRDALEERDGQLSLLQQRLEVEGSEKRRMHAELEGTRQEVGTLESDLNAMTRENQVVNDELAHVVSQRDCLKRDLDEVMNRVAVVEHLLKSCEREKEDILMSYKALNEEKTRAEAACERYSLECSEIRAHVYAREEEVMRLREANAGMEQEMHRLHLQCKGVQRQQEELSERLLDAQNRSKAEAMNSRSSQEELQACKRMAAMLEKQKQDCVKEGCLLRDEIVALRVKLDQVGGEKDFLRSQLEEERGRRGELEGMMQQLRVKEHAAFQAEREKSTDNVELQEKLHKVVTENEHNAQELRLLRSRREELEFELEKHRRLISSKSMEEESMSDEISSLRANVEELQRVVERQDKALQAKREEQSHLKERLQRMQTEAENNERKVLELETQLRKHEVRAQSMDSAERHSSSSLERHLADKEELRVALRRTEEQLERTHHQYKLVKESEGKLSQRVRELSDELEATVKEKEELASLSEDLRLESSKLREEVTSLSVLLEKLDKEHRALQKKFLDLHERAASRSPGHSSPE
ncbi:hypothetical protein GUITHDRAFT_103437 [Guillardia theta CCMP2712]|uniref:Centrosomal protein of 135 kDa n=2 Tax=Guillardia theta TaxID=55529 RepID=L1JRZ9_GUITC|nr:hypothetical protein GUITHDRAFT_103437 [Guillardia theta CCMP2712]EKX50848.1 hypothetical protein GUITHDRAFT_103437 [Guillardia theta CCMP2712]|eukprot:XP_005837828.1 hypothetical protein GUITHDRAFT_103437 [Guillardia theta CCMP2712]